MALIDLSPITLPGENGTAAVANLFSQIIQKASPDQVQDIVQRYLDLTEPFHIVNVAISQNVAQFISKLLNIDVSKVVFTQPAKMTLTIGPPAGTTEASK